MMNIIEKTSKLIGTYSRVSTSRQEEERTIETQLASLREFAQAHGLTIVREYVDDGWSGDILARPSLDQLRQDAKGKLWDAVLIYDPDRLARRYSYQELVMDELRETGVEVMFITVSSPKNSEEKILHGVRGLFAEYERAKIAERFRLGKLRKIREGHILVSEPLYGYNYIPKQDGRHGYYEINSEEAEVIKMIFAWIADQRMTLRTVVRKLQALGIKPRKSHRGVWSTSTLSKLLRNKAYIGEAHWGSSYAVVPQNPTNKDKYRKMKKSSRKMKPEEEWMTVPVPAIIDMPLFDRARAQLASNFALCERNRKNEYLLLGRIFCICGRKRSGEGPQHGKHLYYRCMDRVLSFPLPRTCNERALNARISDRLVWERVVGLMSSPALLSKQINRWMNDRKPSALPSVEDVVAMEREMAKLKEQEERYNRAYGAGIFTIEQLKEYAIPIREKIGALGSRIAKLRQDADQGEINNQMPSEQEINIFSKAARDMLHDLNFPAKRAIVMNTVEKIIGTQQKLQVYGHIPVKNHVEHFTNHRHGMNTTGHDLDRAEAKLIPFSLDIDLPAPDYRTVRRVRPAVG